MTTRFGSEVFDKLRSILPAEVDTATDETKRAAAVLIPLFLIGDEVHVVLTERTQHLRRHSGQVSFPGGGWELGDASLRHTALRESHEEVGLDPSDVEVIGVLDDFTTVGTDYIVRPYVARIPHPYEFVPDAHEVGRIILPPLGMFADLELRREEIRERDGVTYTVILYDFDGAIVWGATARMLVTLVERLES